METTQAAHIELIDESSLRFAVAQFLTQALHTTANSAEFYQGGPDVTLLVNGEEIVFTIKSVTAIVEDFSCEVLLQKWQEIDHEGYVTATVVARFSLDGATITLRDYEAFDEPKYGGV